MFVCICVYLCICVCSCSCVCHDRRRDARVCLISRLGMRGISCKQFSVQQAPHAGVFEAAALFFDTHEESLGPPRSDPTGSTWCRQRLFFSISFLAWPAKRSCSTLLTSFCQAAQTWLSSWLRCGEFARNPGANSMREVARRALLSHSGLFPVKSMKNQSYMGAVGTSTRADVCALQAYAQLPAPSNHAFSSGMSISISSINFRRLLCISF